MSLIEIENTPKNPKQFPRFFVGVAVSMAIASLGLAVGALINFGGVNGDSNELGLGLTLTPACDNAITFLPFNSLENRADPAITLNEIQISNISANCAGKDFIITARDNDGVALALSRDADTAAYTSVRIRFNRFLGEDGSVDVNGNLTNMFTLVGGNPEAINVQAIAGLDPIAPLPESSPGVVDWDLSAPYTYWGLSPENNSVSITFNPFSRGEESSLVGFLNPRFIKAFTLESTDPS